MLYIQLYFVKIENNVKRMSNHKCTDSELDFSVICKTTCIIQHNSCYFLSFFPIFPYLTVTVVMSITKEQLWRLFQDCQSFKYAFLKADSTWIIYKFYNSLLAAHFDKINRLIHFQISKF